MPNVIFVCTGNVFRSLIAEKLAERHCQKEKRMSFTSAGLGILPREINPVQPEVVRRLQELGADPGDHHATQVTHLLLKGQDLVIAMDGDHQLVLNQKYACQSILFHELASGRREGVPDVSDIYPDWQSNPEARLYLTELVDQLDCLMPSFLENLDLALGREAFRRPSRKPEMLP